MELHSSNALLRLKLVPLVHILVQKLGHISMLMPEIPAWIPRKLVDHHIDMMLHSMVWWH